VVSSSLPQYSTLSRERIITPTHIPVSSITSKMKLLHLSSPSCSSGIVSNPCALFEIPTDSVHYRRTSSGASCPVKALPQFEMDRIPMFIHTFGSTANCSLCTQSSAVAHLMPPEHKKSRVVMHRCRRHRNKKLKKQQHLLQEIVPPPYFIKSSNQQ
jgi:hypothetical protein